MSTVQLTRNWLVQLGISNGNDVMPWQRNEPGNQASFTGCVRWNSDSSNDSVYACANTVNNQRWGYNNLNHYVGTWYHKFNERLHFASEVYYMYQRDVPNVNVTGGSYEGTPYAGLRNPPNQAVCNTGARCSANTFAALAYLNYRISDMNNLSLRGEFFNDMQGQRFGYRTRYWAGAVGIQHWLSPSILVRPEIAYYRALDATPFNAGQRNDLIVLAADVILRF